jgi:hypothetical protein
LVDRLARRTRIDAGEDDAAAHDPERQVFEAACERGDPEIGPDLAQSACLDLHLGLADIGRSDPLEADVRGFIAIAVDQDDVGGFGNRGEQQQQLAADVSLADSHE